VIALQVSAAGLFGWLMVAFAFGAFMGLLTLGLLRAAADADLDREERKKLDALERISTRRVRRARTSPPFDWSTHDRGL
jgi:hypothetical protein